MGTAASYLRMGTRLTGTIQIVPGALFWTGNALSLIPIHMLVGLILVLCLWALAGVAAGSGGKLGLVVLAFAWGALVLILGLTQTQLLPGPSHWIVQVVHLLLGLGAIGLAERLAAAVIGPSRSALSA